MLRTVDKWGRAINYVRVQKNIKLGWQKTEWQGFFKLEEFLLSPFTSWKEFLGNSLQSNVPNGSRLVLLWQKYPFSLFCQNSATMPINTNLRVFHANTLFDLVYGNSTLKLVSPIALKLQPLVTEATKFKWRTSLAYGHFDEKKEREGECGW